jgi:hypothetical protein
MRVLCIKDGHSSDPKVIRALKGSYYHVTEVIERKETFEGCNIFYRILETGKYLQSALLFVIAPEEKEDSCFEDVVEVEKTEKVKSAKLV